MARILIVDDDKNSALAIKDSLEFESYEAIVSLSGKDGMNRALNETYDLILLDILLPEVDGYEILRELRKIKKDIPVIIVSGKTSDEDKVFGLNLGADDYAVLDDRTHRPYPRAVTPCEYSSRFQRLSCRPVSRIRTCHYQDRRIACVSR